MTQMRDSLQHFSAPVQSWFHQEVGSPTPAQQLGWPPIKARQSTLLLAPTGSGKTLAAFLAALDRLMFSGPDQRPSGGGKGRAQPTAVLYVSPLKALGADIEKNLRGPVAGISEHARRLGVACRIPSIAMRTGDTPAKERLRLRRAPPDILITTPESLYLMLTSQARQILGAVETVIIDEIHALVPTKRGAHLAISLERLEQLRAEAGPLQRIGLSATQNPLLEVATFLAGYASLTPPTPRQVTIVDAGRSKNLRLSVELPREPSRPANESVGKRAPPEQARSMWSAIHPRLIELIEAHRSTMIFVNNRGLTERLAAALNELVGREICLAHHGSVSKERRLAIEDRLKQGELKAIVSTSSLELGIDVGAVDLVVLIETPASIASGLQRVGRSGHRVGLASKGILFPKHRADLLSAAACVVRMQAGSVEPTHFVRDPLDVLAQQIVAICAMEPVKVDALFDWVRRAAPFASLTRSAYQGVLDMLSGRYASEAFVELSPRLVWDRKRGTLRGRQGAGRIAVTSGGTIPDRGLFGVFLEADTPIRVGELDEEMVFESRVGDVFVLGASSWRIEEIRFDRVIVSPAPAEPGRMPFWRGDAPGRPAEFGRAIGHLARSLLQVDRESALAILEAEHGLEAHAAQQLVAYLEEQRSATGQVPDDRTVVVERFVDEVGDYRFCLLSPLGTPVHAPWALAAEMSFREQAGLEVESIWQNDGIVFRVPEAHKALDALLLFPNPEDVEELVLRQLGQSALFAARFRENAMRALLMPRRRPGGRTPLWAQRKRSARLLREAAAYPDFPIMVETYRECLRDIFDLTALKQVLAEIRDGTVRTLIRDSVKPSPFSSSLLFAYAGNFLYDKDAPLAERRAHVLGLSHTELRQLLGEAELRKLLDEASLRELAEVLSGRKYAVIRHADGLADALLSYGDLERPELAARTNHPELLDDWLGQLLAEGRALALPIAGRERFIAVEDAGRYRDALGIELPLGLPEAFTEPVREPMIDLVARYARGQVPFTTQQVAEHFGVGVDSAEQALAELERRGRLISGEFLPHGTGPEWCDREVLRLLKRRSLEALRRQIEPVEPARLVELVLHWQHVDEPRHGLDGLLDTLEQLEGMPLSVSELEQEVLPARVADFVPSFLDELISSGEIVWRGMESVGQRDGRVALYLADRYSLLAPASELLPGPLVERIREILAARGALFFQDLVAALGAFPPELLRVLWQMVWAGEVSNDTFAPLRSLGTVDQERPRGSKRPFRSRRAAPPGSEGRWSLLPVPNANTGPSAESLTAWAELLLGRHAILTREAMQHERFMGSASNLLVVLRAMEERSRVRRGYFVAGLSGQQFAAVGAGDRLRRPYPESAARVLSASDPANLYGTVLPWPEGSPRPVRALGSKVVIAAGELLAYASKGFASLTTFFQNEPERRARALASALDSRVAEHRPGVMLIETVDGEPARTTLLGQVLLDLGFTATARGALRKGTGKKNRAN